VVVVVVVVRAPLCITIPWIENGYLKQQLPSIIKPLLPFLPIFMRPETSAG